jgi:hypothetical protein
VHSSLAASIRRRSDPWQFIKALCTSLLACSGGLLLGSVQVPPLISFGWCVDKEVPLGAVPLRRCFASVETWLGLLLRTGSLCCGCLVCSRRCVGLRSLLVASGAVLVLKLLPSILSKKDSGRYTSHFTSSLRPVHAVMCMHTRPIKPALAPLSSSPLSTQLQSSHSLSSYRRQTDPVSFTSIQTQLNGFFFRAANWRRRGRRRAHRRHSCRQRSCSQAVLPRRSPARRQRGLPPRANPSQIVSGRYM